MADPDDMQVKLCQQEIIKLNLHIQAIIQDIRECEGPLEELQDYNQDVRNAVQDVKERLEELERLAYEQDKETDKAAILRQAENHRKQVQSTQQELRKANLSCQLTIERREKENLLDGAVEVRKRSTSNKASIAKTATDVTENLMSLSRTLAAQVQKGERTLGSVVSSSSQIREVGDEFGSMSGHIHTSRKLLTKYSRRECTDKLLILLAIVFFFATVLYIVKKRLFNSPAYGNLPAQTSI